MWPGEAVFENHVNKQKVERTTTEKPNKPQALAQQGLRVAATLSPFSEELSSEELNRKKPTPKKAHRQAMAGERELPARRRGDGCGEPEQDQIHPGQPRC